MPFLRIQAPAVSIAIVALLHIVHFGAVADERAKPAGPDKADTPKATAQRVLDLVKEKKIDDALKLVVPINQPVGADEDREHLQQIEKAFVKGVQVELVEEHVLERAAAVVVLFKRPGRGGAVDPDPLLLLKRDGQWKLLTDDPGQYKLSDEERKDLERAQAWFTQKEKERPGR